MASADGQTWEGAPVERIAPAAHSLYPNVLIVCDHATNIVPPGLDLGLPAAEMGRHIAYDLGARGVALEIARELGAGAVLSRFSRLVIDPNRGEDDPTLLMKLYDGTIIPGNRHADLAERERRLDAYYRPYHATLGEAIDGIEASGQVPVLVSIHSYTPQLRGRPLRPWHVGVLWDRDGRLPQPLIEALTGEQTPQGAPLCVGDNQPYTGELTNDCMNRHGTQRDLPHALIELRHDLIDSAAGQRVWAALVTRALIKALAHLGAQPAA
ncbi:MAG: N-formylglutamate amidohydrolase [Pseudomonadota bacterium]